MGPTGTPGKANERNKVLSLKTEFIQELQKSNKYPSEIEKLKPPTPLEKKHLESYKNFIKKITETSKEENLNSLSKNQTFKNYVYIDKLVKEQRELLKRKKKKQRVQGIIDFTATLQDLTENKKTKISQLKNQLSKTNNSNVIERIETELADLLGKPQILLLLNKIKSSNNINKTLNTNLLDFKITSNNTSEAQQKASEHITNKLKNFVGASHVNIFFNGPSGSGKTTLFEGFIDKNPTQISVKAYYPIFRFEDGVLTISDSVSNENMSFKKFSNDYIRPTPFNPQSSRAHMSYEMLISENKRSKFGGKEKLRVFDLAGAENPMAIMFRTFGFNAFKGIPNDKWKDMKYDILKTINKTKQFEEFLKNKTGPNDNDGLSNLAKIFLFYLLRAQFPTPTPGMDLNDAHKVILKNRHNRLSDLCYDKTKVFNGQTFNDIIPLHYAGTKDKNGVWTRIPIFVIKPPSQHTAEYKKIKKMYEDPKINPTVIDFLYESFKRVIEGFYITRSLFSLRYAFTSSGASTSGALEGLKKLNVNNKNIAPFKDASDGNSMKINFTSADVGKQLASFGRNPVPFVPIPQNRGITYKTKFLEEVLKSEEGIQYKNLIVGVVNGNPGNDDELRKQQQVAINYLKTLTPTGGSVKK